MDKDLTAIKTDVATLYDSLNKYIFVRNKNNKEVADRNYNHLINITSIRNDFNKIV